MGAPKQKWTPEEEHALRAGVEKYGPGKWRAIQKDPEYGPELTQRSNVDLKDKWRNMSVAAGGQLVQVTPKKERSSRGGSSEPSSPEPVREVKGISNKKFLELITGAIAALKDKGGSNIAAISKHIEERREVPPNFRRMLQTRLRVLCESGKLVKVKQSYRLAASGDAPGSEPRASRRSRGASDAANGGGSSSKAEPSGSGASSPPESSALAGGGGGGHRLRDGKERGAGAGGGRGRAAAGGGAEATPERLAVSRHRKEERQAAKRARVEADMAKSKMRTAEEAARVAAAAVAEAEAAAAAAEQAARDAEAAEAEAEAAEAAAEAAAAALRPPKKRASSVKPKA
eukprot:jgi/Mesen1/1379/ME000013S00874